MEVNLHLGSDKLMEITAGAELTETLGMCLHSAWGDLVPNITTMMECHGQLHYRWCGVEG